MKEIDTRSTSIKPFTSYNITHNLRTESIAETRDKVTLNRAPSVNATYSNLISPIISNNEITLPELSSYIINHSTPHLLNCDSNVTL